MSRLIYCRDCGAKPALAKEDEARGWTSRKVYVSIHEPPKDHGITVNGVFTKVDAIHCDLCNKNLNGSIAVCITRIPPEKSVLAWEWEYGSIMTEEAVKLADKLAGYEKVGGPHAR